MTEPKEKGQRYPDLPEWFQIGARVRFRGVPPEYVVESIDYDHGSWVGSLHGDQGRYPLSEVRTFWTSGV